MQISNVKATFTSHFTFSINIYRPYYSLRKIDVHSRPWGLGGGDMPWCELDHENATWGTCSYDPVLWLDGYRVLIGWRCSSNGWTAKIYNSKSTWSCVFHSTSLTHKPTLLLVILCKTIASTPNNFITLNKFSAGFVTLQHPWDFGL